MGRKFCVLLVWEGNGKEMLCTVYLGRKWEGNVKYYKQGREVGRKKCGFSIWEGKRKEIDLFLPIFIGKGKSR